MRVAESTSSAVASTLAPMDGEEPVESISFCRGEEASLVDVVLCKEERSLLAHLILTHLFGQSHRKQKHTLKSGQFLTSSKTSLLAVLIVLCLLVLQQHFYREGQLICGEILPELCRWRESM